MLDAHAHLLNVEGLSYPVDRAAQPVLEALLDNYYDAARPYGVGRYRGDAGGRVTQWVACEFGAADGIAEAEWIQRCSALEGGPGAFIGAVDLTSAALGEVLARYRDLPVVHAVRQPLYWAEDPFRRLGARPDFPTDPAWWRGFERVAEEGLTWDLLVYDEQIPAAHQLIRAFPQTRIVLEAAVAAGPERRRLPAVAGAPGGGRAVSQRDVEAAGTGSVVRAITRPGRAVGADCDRDLRRATLHVCRATSRSTGSCGASTT